MDVEQRTAIEHCCARLCHEYAQAIDVLSTDEARGTAYLTLYRHTGSASLKLDPIPFNAPAAIGHYEDRYQNGPSGWLFLRRKLFLAFRNTELLPDRSS